MMPSAFRRHAARVLQPGKTLLVVSVLLPAIVFGLAALQARRDALREARSRVERSLVALHEHAVKVFETQRLVTQQVNVRLRFLDWRNEADKADLHEQLRRVQEELDQVVTISVTDAEGRLRASSRSYPLDTGVAFADRDWFEAVRSTSGDGAYVSRAYIGRQSGEMIFNIATRAWSPSPSRFDGAVIVSIDQAYFEDFYRTVEPNSNHLVILARRDGQILARDPPRPEGVGEADGVLPWELREMPPSRPVVRVSIDGHDHLVAHRQVGDYPVFVLFAVPVQSALLPWRDYLFASAVVAALAMAVLLAASSVAIHHARRERVVRFRWQDSARQLEAEAAVRGRVEEQLRQSQKMEALGRLTGGVAHDFNNLLTVVIGNLDILRRRASLDERAERLAAAALDGANRAASLTHRLLAFSRQQPLAPKAIDANAMLDGMADILFRTLGEDVAVEIIRAPDLWPVFADANGLENAVLNLAVNGRDAMREGGRLILQTGNLPATGDEPDRVAIAVRDTGTGMTPDVLAKAFDPFFTTKPVGQGTGLGLSQVYGFASQSGGRTTIDTEVGWGTTITIALPRHREGGTTTTAATMRATEPEYASGRGETILVCEDEAAVRAVSTAILEGAGYRVLAVADAPAALDALRSTADVALLFTDVVLAGSMNGRRLADEAAKLRPALPVLFTTGYTRDAIVRDGRIEEGLDLIGKPFTAATLTGRVRSMLDRKAAAG